MPRGTKWIVKIPRPIRMPVLTAIHGFLAYQISAFLFSWPPRDNNGVRIPTEADKQFQHDSAYYHIKEMYRTYTHRKGYDKFMADYLTRVGVDEELLENFEPNANIPFAYPGPYYDPANDRASLAQFGAKKGMEEAFLKEQAEKQAAK